MEADKLFEPPAAPCVTDEEQRPSLSGRRRPRPTSSTGGDPSAVEVRAAFGTGSQVPTFRLCREARGQRESRALMSLGEPNRRM